MSNQAIGETTIAIKTVLEEALGNGYKVSLYEPWSNFGNVKGINLYLYRVEENAQWKNMDWPGTKGNPIANNHIPLSLVLYYLLTPYAPKANAPESDDAECHRILGMAMQVLHENPVLSAAQLSQELADNFEKIKITQHPITMEDMSKVWTMGNNPYKLSVAYHVSFVQIAPSLSSIIAKEVKKTELGIIQKQEPTILIPVIEKVEPVPVHAGDKIRLTGKHLKGERIKINFGSWSQLLKENISEGELEYTVPDYLTTGDYNVIVTVNENKSNRQLVQIINDKA